MSVTLRIREKRNGEKTLRLDIYHNNKRRYQALKHLVLLKENNQRNREHNKEIMRQAEKIRIQYAARLEANDYEVPYDMGRKTIVVHWFQSFIDKYTKSDKRNFQGALNKFKSYLKNNNIINITFSELNQHVIEEFMEYLENTGTGEGPSSYFNRFKKLIRYSQRNNLVKENFLSLINKKIKGKAKEKDILLIEELELLSKTSISNLEVRNAFIFCAVTGLRWCDIKGLKWSCIDDKIKYLKVSQLKTKHPVYIPLNVIAIKILEKCIKDKEFVFELPSANGANKLLKCWVKRAGINKKITWHNARHSFGTNLVLNETDIVTTSLLLGHTSIKHTQRYIHIANQLKEKATDKINFNYN